MTNLQIGHLNIRSIFTGFHEFKILIENRDFDIIFLTETWFSDGDDTGVFGIPGYRIIRKDRIGRGGGIAVYIRSNLYFETVHFDFNITDFLEFLILKVKIKNKMYAFCVFYRPPNTNFNSIINDFDNIFSDLYPTVDEIVCLGDFNVNLLKIDNPLVPLFENYNFVQIVDQPTRISRTASSLLDPIFVTDESLVSEFGVISADDISDHCLVYCCLRIEGNCITPKIITYRNFNNFNVNLFLQDLHDLQWNEILYEQNLDNKITLFNELLLSLFDRHAPFKEARITKTRAPWLTPDLKVFMRQRDRALQQFKRTKLVQDWDNYKRLRNFTVTMIRRGKKQYLDTICAEGNPQKTWKTLKSFNICSSKNLSIPHNLSDPANISNFFGTFLQNISDCSQRISFYNTHFFNNELRFFFRMAEINEINKIVSSIHTNAAGVDGISSKMLKYCSPYIDRYVTHIINCCIEASYFPDQWKISIGKPLPKTKNPLSFNDIRIISILPILSKVFEKVLYSQIFEYCILNNIIPDTQCGFRKHFSTSVAMVGLTDDIIAAIDKQLNSILVLLDFSKAFDTLNHALLLAKLKFYGFSKSSLDLVKSFFFNRYQKVFSNNHFSDQVQILSGVPQGSILGPLFFIIYTSDILKSLNYCKVQAYADDTQIYCHFKHDEYLNASILLNEELNSLNRLSLEHNLHLNPSKSSLMIFGNKGRADFLSENMNITIDGVRLPIVKRAKNLGIILDTELRFREYVKSLIQRSFLSLKILYNNRHVLSFSLRKMLCESLVLSNFNYCDFVYGPCLDAMDRDRIQKVQNACSRLVFGLRKFNHISHTFGMLNWLKMDYRRTLHLGKFVMRILKNPVLPVALKRKFVFRENIHSRNIRFTGVLTVPHHRSAMFQRSFTYNAIKVYNSLPNELVILNLELFGSHFKKYLFNLQNVL